MVAGLPDRKQDGATPEGLREFWPEVHRARFWAELADARPIFSVAGP